MSLNFADYKRLEIPEGRVKKITDQSGRVLWEAGYVNMVPLSINADGSIYNGVGYKDGYRVRSGGAESSLSTSACTGFVPVSGGDVVRISGADFANGASHGSALNVANASFANIGQFSMLSGTYGIFLESAYSSYAKSSVVEEKAGVWRWVVPPASSGVAYVRISANAENGGKANGAKLIVTINEEIA